VIAKFPGFCMFCKKPIEPGKDIYDVSIKQSYHETCLENRPPGPEAFALADRLGFIEWNPDLPADGLLRSMCPGNRVAPAGRPPNTAHRNENTSLFD
jgi:hypothetical protein